MKIKVRGERGPEPTELPPPGDRRGTAVIDPGRVTPPGLPVYVLLEAYEAMFAHAEQGQAYEVGGFLLGGYHRHRRHRYLDVTTAVPALKAQSARTHLTFSNEAQREFHASLATRYPGRTVLGWYHTHPRYSVFLSDYDLFIQRGFFAQEYHLAIVLDPYQHFRHDRMGVFVWEQGDVSHGYHPIVYEAGRD